ncbi:YceK/YidQ family lipoprotein [Limnoglobus roseus]|uniref:YceK/YidQ family lipoprotein n=1 Tax=Limnoglobus roseus TaxID=2598579 RepID=A0A5C1AHK2_9BACT|nr:YceK/YidQ family lipoprotein [Limnoglobus roseus]QEL16448.1 YceK/YidQ family lipoprotein [Limnoglobus roseus]
MPLRATRVALLSAVLPLAGCGTVTNLAVTRIEDGGRLPFGGVKHDVRCIHGAADDQFGAHAHPRPEQDGYPRTALMLLCAADLPLSLVADTVLWPYLKAYNRINQPVPYPPVTIGGTLPPQATNITAPALSPSPPLPTAAPTQPSSSAPANPPMSQPGPVPVIPPLPLPAVTGS